MLKNLLKIFTNLIFRISFGRQTMLKPGSIYKASKKATRRALHSTIAQFLFSLFSNYKNLIFITFNFTCSPVEAWSCSAQTKNIARGTTDPEIDSLTWTKFSDHMAALVTNLATTWRHLH